MAVVARGRLSPEEFEEIERDLERFRRDGQYFEEHWDELLERYPERWVAVYHRHVVGAAKDIRRLVRQLERKGIPPGFVAHRYVTDCADLLML